jgi:hypothetical protein
MFLTGEKKMKRLIISFVCLLGLTGCYQFTTPPFSQSEMTPLKDSTLAQEIVSAIGNIPKSDETREMVESLKEIDVVYEISPTLVVAQETDESGTSLTALMKNEHHFMICSPMADEEKENFSGQKINIRAGNSPMEPKIVDGDAAALKAWAEDYIVNGAKMCIAVPYADARK